MSKSRTYDPSVLFKSHMIYRLLVLITLVSIQRSSLAQYSDHSVLADGQIYKISTQQDGVYRMSYDFLKIQLGVNIDDIDPRNIQIYGNGGGLLPENIDNVQIDDLAQNNIIVIGEDDGRFDPSDYILFYGQAADQRIWNSTTNLYTQPKNIYADEVTYYLKIANTVGARIRSSVPPANPTYESTTSDTHTRIEDETVNLLDDFNGASGTGQAWYGDLYKGLRTKSYNISADNIINGADIRYQIAFAARSGITSTLNIDIEGQVESKLIGGVNLGDSEGRYARIGVINGTVAAIDEVINIHVDYPQNSSNNIGWLDFIEVNYRKALLSNNTYKPFSDYNSLTHTASTFRLRGASNDTQIWDISAPLSPQLVETQQNGGDMIFHYESDQLRTFVASNNGSQLTPKAIGVIDNQDLHNITDVDMVIIYHPELIDAAELFVAHRSTLSGLKVEMVNVEDIYNEFGSGTSSPVAIRDFAKMLYDRSDTFKFMMLLGDASFDFKNLKNLPTSTNLVPTYETKESLDPIRGFPSDDFYALLSPGEGGNLRGALDIAVGRLPAKTSVEAMNMINKIISYEQDQNRLGDWVNKITFVADDEDFNIHLNQADRIAQKLTIEHPIYNIEKIYLDAFKQVSTAGGQLYPDVQSAINNSLFKGTNVINYMGHGGSTGFAQERILTINDVSNWSNADRLALFVTATCSFTGYDDPNFVTAGERAILNPTGGAIALFTTVRAVYSSSNERLTKAVFDNLFKKVNGHIPAIGEILRIAKNSNAADTIGINARKFLLIGDPSLHLARPTHDIETTHINDLLLAQGDPDTLKALDPVTIKGQIISGGSLQSNFNGDVDIIIFDKSRSVNTLGQDNTSFVRSFETQKNIIFKGAATVTNGTFSYSFVVPKDIDYQFGNGKISYYAQSDNNEDAAGYYNDLIVGGTSANPLVDDNGPEINIFMNTENFTTGGITGPNPTLIVHLKDDYGINVVGNSIGHDITAVLDNETSKTIILNEFYKSELNNTTAGTVRFPLIDIDEGTHTIEVKAWDVANNSTVSSIDFVVATDSQSAINRILNYPNPVIDQTSFLIDHNISSGLLDITIDIFALDGKLVQSLKYISGTNAGLIDNLNWDGNNSSGQSLSTGIYVYKVTIKDSDDSSKEAIHSKLEKIVILK